MTYEEFLKSANIISEEDFNNVIKELPDIEYDVNNLIIGTLYDLNSSKDVALTIIEAMLYNWNYVYLDDINLECKTILISDVDSLNDLDDIKTKFYPWTISNYEELKNNLTESETDSKKYFLLDKLRDLITVEELEKLINDYEQKKSS